MRLITIHTIMNSVSRKMWKVVAMFIINCVVLAVHKVSAQSIADTGEPLYLTPLLEEGNVAEAQEKSRVDPDIGNTTSYSGYLTINKECESNLFFWYFPAQNNSTNAPLILWLNGGPGASSVFSLFMETGPLTYDGEVGSRKYSWNVENNLLFIDQPVGSGFSFTRRDCYPKNDSEIGKELYFAVIQFYKLFPELLHNKFFISGYSYAGHYIPALALEIHRNNPTAKIKIKLSGMAIGNGFFDSLHQFDWSHFLYHIGLIDKVEKETCDSYYHKFVNYTKNQEWEIALIASNILWPSLMKSCGNVSIYHYLKGNNNYIYGVQPYEDFVKSENIRKAIHVGNESFLFYNPKVAQNLGTSVIFSMKPQIEELLEHYFMVFYTGQLDIICAYPMIVNFLQDLNWSGSVHYRNATRHKWCVEGEQAGFYKSAHNLHEVMVRNAGHSVAYDQPHWAYVLANSVTSGSQDSPLHALNSC